MSPLGVLNIQLQAPSFKGTECVFVVELIHPRSIYMQPPEKKNKVTILEIYTLFYCFFLIVPLIIQTKDTRFITLDKGMNLFTAVFFQTLTNFTLNIFYFF